jgi:hypothetical protein
MTKSIFYSVAILLLLASIYAFVKFGPEDKLIAGQHSHTAEFWNRLSALCGHSYEGTIRRQDMQPRYIGERMVIDVYDCGENHVSIRTMSEITGDNARRTHTYIRHGDGRLELRHEYLNPDGTPANITGHGGFANNPGSERAQIFPADLLTIENMPSFWNWVWMGEIDPGERYVYHIEVVGTDIVTRTEYDLSREIETPAN